MSIAPPFLWPGDPAIAIASASMAATSSKRSWSDMDESRKRSRFIHARSTSDVSSRLSSSVLAYGSSSATMGYSSSSATMGCDPASASASASLGYGSRVAPPVSYPAAPWPGPTETTASGLPISCDPSLLRDDISIASGAASTSSSSHSSSSPHAARAPLSDAQAAHIVREHLGAAPPHRSKPSHHHNNNSSSSSNNSQHARILRTLVSPRTRAADFALDDAALASIFSSANELFFAGRLQGRVAWDWSHARSPQYRQHVIGTTAVRRRPAAAGGGLDTLIILSRPILRDGGFNRRLLISTFLHEMIHCFLFVCCGMAAVKDGGHTPGFKEIARLIDGWAGQDTLHLCEMEADLERFRDSPQLVADARDGSAADAGSGTHYYHPHHAGYTHYHHHHYHHHYHYHHGQQQHQTPENAGVALDAPTKPLPHPVYHQPVPPRRSNPVIDTRRQIFDHRHHTDSSPSPSPSREFLQQPTPARPAVHEHSRHAHYAPSHTHRRYHAYADRPLAVPLNHPRHPYHPVTSDRWDSPLVAPLSATPSPSPSPNSSAVFVRRFSMSQQHYGGL